MVAIAQQAAPIRTASVSFPTPPRSRTTAYPQRPTPRGRWASAPNATTRTYFGVSDRSAPTCDLIPPTTVRLVDLILPVAAIGATLDDLPADDLPTAGTLLLLPGLASPVYIESVDVAGVRGGARRVVELSLRGPFFRPSGVVIFLQRSQERFEIPRYVKS